MSKPPAKRQRTDKASIALSKPFRSPLKNPTVFKSLVPLMQHLPRSEASKSLLQTPFTSLKETNSKTIYSSPISLTGSSHDPDIATLIRARQQLEKQLRELREELDTVEQARTIEVDSKRKNPQGAIDEELIQLILRWRLASRQAAEELFTIVRDRVNRIGGPKVWKEMQDKQKEFRSGWDVKPAPQIDSDNEDGLDRENEDLHVECDIDSETENEKEARGANEYDEEEVTEEVIQPMLRHMIIDFADILEEFTMGMMLRSLNVPFDAIGYEREDQRWGE